MMRTREKNYLHAACEPEEKEQVHTMRRRLSLVLMGHLRDLSEDAVQRSPLLRLSSW